jgi:hypothetical protein
MPAAVYEKLQSLVQELFLDPSFEEFQAKYPWLAVNKSDWKVFGEVASYWVDTSKYEPKLLSVKQVQVLEQHYPDFENEEENNLASLEAMVTGDMSFLTRRMQEKKEEERQRLEAMKESYRDISNWSPDFTAVVRIVSAMVLRVKCLLNSPCRSLTTSTSMKRIRFRVPRIVLRFQ